MGRSLIQTANTSIQTTPVSGLITPGITLRRFGCNCRLNGDATELDGAGYYTISATITVSPTAAGPVTVEARLNGVTIPGATATASTIAGGTVTLPIITTVRQGCECDGASQLIYVLTAGAGTVSNFSQRVEKA